MPTPTKLVFFVLISVNLFLGCAFAPSKVEKDKAQLHLQIGTSHFMKGHYPQALTSLLEAEKLDPTDATIQNNLGLTYMVREKFDDAERCFKKALELKKSYTDARNNLGQLYITVGLYKDAISHLEIAVSDLEYDKPEKSWASLGHAYFLSKNYSKAATAFQNSLKNNRESCFTLNFFGRTLFELNKFKPAAESLDRAVQLCDKPNWDEPRFYSGLSFFKLGDLDQARARFAEVVKLYPLSKYAKQSHKMLGMME